MEKVAAFLAAAFTLVLAGCAGQFPPSGGPIDTTPPKVVRSSPFPNQVDFTSDEIKIEWDKYMVERSVESSVYFPPFEPKDLIFDWSGKELTVRVEKPFDKDRTYIFTVGARAQDLHGNFLGKAYTIVFSSGSRVDTGSITGTIYSRKAQPYAVAAYPVNADIDTLNPSETLPKFVTESDDSGRYVLQGLATGKYRLICFDDQMRNFLYAPQYDGYASATHEVDLEDENIPADNVNFTIGVEDTARPQLYSAALANDGLLELKFSEPIDTSDLRPAYFIVRDSASGKIFPADFAARLESDEFSVVVRTDSALPLRRKYFVTATDSVKDVHGNRMSPSANTAVLEPDSASARVAPYYFNFPDSAKGTTAYDTVFCQFVIPSMNGVPTNPRVDLIDSTGEPLADLVNRESQTMFSVRLKKLNASEKYRLRLSYHSYSGGEEKDSIVTRTFIMIDSMQIGELDGKATPSVPGRKIVIAAEKSGGKTFYTLAKDDGSFSLDKLPAGNYRIFAYYRHGDGMRYFSGRSHPYEFASPFGVYYNDVKVRARWTTEGVAIIIR